MPSLRRRRPGGSSSRREYGSRLRTQEARQPQDRHEGCLVPLSHTIAYVFPSNLARSLGVSRSSRTRTRRYAADVVFARAAPFAHSGHCSSSSSYAIPWIGHRTISSGVTSLDHLIGAQQQGLRDRQAEGFRRLQVYDELELGRLLDGKFRRLCAFENPVDLVRQAPPNNREGVLSVAHQAALPAERILPVYGWQAMPGGQINDALAMRVDEGIAGHQKRPCARLDHFREERFEIVAVRQVEHDERTAERACRPIKALTILGVRGIVVGPARQVLQQRHALEPRHDRLDELEPFAVELGVRRAADPGNVSSRPGQVRDELVAHRITKSDDHEWGWSALLASRRESR